MVYRFVRKLAAFALAGVVSMIASLAGAQQYTPPNYSPPDDIKQWLSATSKQDPVPSGTTITNSNWQQYQKEMS